MLEENHEFETTNSEPMQVSEDDYSNYQGGKREQCRKIMDSVDKYMLRMNFIRMNYTFAPNLNNNAIARLIAKYQVVADDTNFYRIGR